MKDVLAYLQNNQRRFVNELCAYLRFPSVSADPRHAADMTACARWLTRHCRQIGLQTELHRTAGHPIVIARTPRAAGSPRPHYLVYGHYDVQPPDPLDQWTSPPFVPRVTRRAIHARGASDNKGQHFAHLKAVEAYLKTRTPLPCDLTFVIEGEEETGSRSLGAFLRRHRAALRAEAMIVSDGIMPSLRQPALTCGLRGLCALEVEVRGPRHDLHSGLHGGAVANPAQALCGMLAALRDRRGRVAAPGFYDQVRPLLPAERRRMAALPFAAKRELRALGLAAFAGEAGFTPVERRTARPTLEINGLTAGYQGPGEKTIIPAWARAKLTCRLVPDQPPRRIQALVASRLRRLVCVCASGAERRARPIWLPPKIRACGPPSPRSRWPTAARRC